MNVDDVRPRWRRLPGRKGIVGLVVVAALAVLALVAVAGLWRASGPGAAGKKKLTKAEADLLAQRFVPAQRDLQLASQDFRLMRHDLHAFPFGPALAFWRVIPLVRVQVRAVDTLADVGASLSQAGGRITDAATTIERPSGDAAPLSASLDKLRGAQSLLQGGIEVLVADTAKVKAYDRYRLFGSIGRAQREADTQLAHIDASAKSSDQALTALIAFSGGDGPRQYLVMSQNPDELRPTGGFLGSYGVLSAVAGHVQLIRYDDIVTWIEAHPSAVVPVDQVGSPFRFYDPPLAQTFANVNAVPDWPSVAQLALKLWQQGGEAPVNGVVSFTPGFMSRVLAVTGPVSVPSYNETVTAKNVVARLDYYTHQLAPPPGTDRKAFLSPLGQAVMTKLLNAPPSEWLALGTAMSKAFATNELEVWSQDPAVESALVARGWDGVLPAAAGDFFYDGEFEYAAKNGGGLKRTFDHQVVLQADGSAQATTTITIDNTEAAGQVNDNVLTYYTIYGPTGAVVDTTDSDPPFSTEAAVNGHPAAGWFRTVTAMTTGTIKVVWDVPGMAQLLSNGDWQYSLHWVPIVDNSGDVLNLSVSLPPNAHWVGPAPPTQWKLNRALTMTWTYRIGR